MHKPSVYTLWGKRQAGFRENSLFKTDTSLLSNTDKIRVLKSKYFLRQMSAKTRLFQRSRSTKQYLASEKVTYAEYEWLLNHYLRGKSLNEWLFTMKITN